jgi:hypothetical protein
MKLECPKCSYTTYISDALSCPHSIGKSFKYYAVYRSSIDGDKVNKTTKVFKYNVNNELSPSLFMFEIKEHRIFTYEEVEKLALLK